MEFSVSVDSERLEKVRQSLAPYSRYLYPLASLSEDRKDWTNSERAMLQFAYDTYNETESFFECCPCEIQACNYIKALAPEWLASRRKTYEAMRFNAK